MKLTKDEKEQISKSLSVLKGLFDEQLGETVAQGEKQIDSKFVKLLQENYLTESGLSDLLQDYGMLEKTKGCDMCSAPCTVSCVKPCTSVCQNLGSQR